MKTVKLISIALAGALLVLSACKKDNGEPQSESSINVTPTVLSFTKDGGTQELTLKVSNSWKAEVDAEWCTLSAYEGDKDAFIDVTAEASTSEKETTAVIKFTDTRGNTASVTVKRAGTGDKPGPTPTGEKCKASDYPQVTIGTQVWMAENYHCSKYDTQSEAYNASWLTNNTVPTSSSRVYTPYYTDASDKSKWNSDSQKYAGNLIDAQVKKLGYLYNWAAAVGVENGQTQKTAFTGKRQGICPNGWHIPTSAEWQTLVDYIEKTDGKGTDTAGKHLKTTSGWYNGDSSYKSGLDTYGFAALPAGYAYGSSVSYVGNDTYFWTATPTKLNSGCAYTKYLYYGNDYLDDGVDYETSGQSVRCLMD